MYQLVERTEVLWTAPVAIDRYCAEGGREHWQREHIIDV